MSNHYSPYERILIDKLKDNDKTAFTIIFLKYYHDLVHFSFNLTSDLNASEELVQEIFVKLWENRNSLDIHHSLKSFLLKAVQNRSIDYLRHLDVKQRYLSVILENPSLVEHDTENYVLHSELEENFTRALKKIPEAYSRPFLMSRFESKNYAIIAEELGVSVRTIEVRIAKALTLLRQELKDFL